jgi:hypothetical protein
MVPPLWSFRARSLTFIALADEERSVFSVSSAQISLKPGLHT